MTKNLITELVCTRLSHDIAGSIGAVANAVELLEEGDLDFLDDIRSILKTSSQTLAARMKFFRMAFGLDNALLNDEKTVLLTAQNYLASLGNKDYPLQVSIQTIEVSKRKTALLMVMIMADLIIRGGQIKIFAHNGGLAAEAVAAGKLADEKLNKMQNIVSTNSVDEDANLAPLYALMSSNYKLSFYRTDNMVQLVAE